MVKLLKSLIVVLALFLTMLSVSATQQQILVEMNEYVNQYTEVNPLKYSGGIGTWADDHENISNFNFTGYLIVTNTNPNSKTMSDIYVSLTNTGNITLPTYFTGRTGTWISNDTSSQNIILHIPELNSGENATFLYSINNTTLPPVLNFTTNFSDSKILAGDNLTLTDTIQNNFDNLPFQTETCIFDINITQTTVDVNFSGLISNWLFYNDSLTGPDATNATFSADNLTLNWDALNTGCLDINNVTSINYKLLSPNQIPKSQHYIFMNSTLRYKLNSTISHLSVADITAISEAKLSVEKKIVGPSDPVLYGSNVTWKINGKFNTETNISYNLTSVTLWVSQRNVNGSYTDPNTIDNDTINTTKTLNISLSPFTLVNITAPWTSSDWFFNYSDVPSPIVWANATYNVLDDGTQLVNKSIIQNGNDIYIKELYLILGYWLEINKNITSLGGDLYNVKIDVRNKGNQKTPADTVVTIYDFVPGNFNVTGSFVFSTPPWYTTTQASNNITGNLNGTLYQFGLLPSNVYNTSLDAGPTTTENTTWTAEYNVSGLGDYTLIDVFITGLDPQQVDGAGSTKAVVVSEVIDKIKSTEGVFAMVASILLLLGLVL